MDKHSRHAGWFDVWQRCCVGRRRLADACGTCHRYERQLRACGFVSITILWARFGFVTWIAHKNQPTKEEEEEEEEQQQQLEEHKAAAAVDQEGAISPALSGSLSTHASSFVHWSLTGVLQTDAASAVAFSSDAQGQAFEVCAWGLSQVQIFVGDCSKRQRGRESFLLSIVVFPDSCTSLKHSWNASAC